jgi:formate hydrogenlyase transcriptional activator
VRSRREITDVDLLEGEMPSARHEGFERLISDLSNAFAVTSAEDVDGQIDTWLQRVAEFLGVEGTAVPEFAADCRSALIRHSWMAPGLPPLPQYMTDADWPWVFGQLVKGQAVGFESTGDLPAEARVDIQTYDRLSVKSCLSVPLSCGGTVLGALALGTLRRHCRWPELLTQRIRLVGEIFGSALARKRAHEKLQGMIKEWQTTFDATSDAVMVVDTEFRVTRANAAAAWLLNLSLEQIIGRKCYVLMHGTDEPMSECPVRTAAATKQHAECELHDEGRDAWYLVSADPILGAFGQIGGFVHTVTDITRRKRAEEELRRSEERFRDMCRNLPGVVYQFYARDGGPWGFHYIDPRVKDLYGLDIDPLETFYDRFLACVPEQDRPRWRMSIGQSVEAVKPWSCEGWFLKPDGQEVYIRGISQPKRVNGQVVFDGILLDVTERRQAELALSKAYQEIQALKDQLQAENLYLREELDSVAGRGQIVGHSDAICRVIDQGRQVAGTDSTVLILGETGTGKELLAHFIHEASPRSARPFVVANLAAMPPTLIESELFGREKGAFTGAITRQPGRFEVADGGTIFLDEIGEVPAETQAKLLRVIQNGQFERLGSSRTIQANVRVIAATNRDLAAAVRDGRFRQDLYYRLNVFPITVPPLRERPEDIPLLAQAFVREFSERMGKAIESIQRRSLESLQAYAWPGNVRELRNVIERSMILAQGTRLRVVLPESRAPDANGSAGLRDVESQHIRRVLETTGWRIRGRGGAAEVLGLKPSTLYSKIKKLGILRDR